MKICIITSWFPTTEHPYLAPFVNNFIKNLGKSGVDVNLITVLTKGDKPLSKEDSITIYRINPKFPLFAILQIVNRIQPDIIHVHAPNFFGSYAIITAKLRRIPIIATVHRTEIIPVRNPVLHYLRRFALRRFDKIIAVSYFSKSLARNAGAKEDRISVIYNSSDESRFFVRDKLTCRKKFSLPTEKRIILFVGNFIRRKGIYTLIDSLRTVNTVIPDFLAILVGGGEEQPAIKSRILEYGLSEKVKLYGRVSEGNLPYLYNSADVFVLPSTMEGHSVALLEAMASGLPIVASDIEGNRESLEDGINGLLFQSGNEKDLSEKLVTVLNDA